MRKATMSFEECREALLRRMSEKAAKGSISKKVMFSNDEVVKFLRNLDKFESESLKSSLVFK